MSQAKLNKTYFQLQIKSGLEANINSTATKNLAVVGEPHFATDTRRQTVFDGTLNVPLDILPYVIKSVAYTLTDADHTIEVDTAGATQTLPSAVNRLGKPFRIINASASTVRVNTTSSQTIGNKVSGNPTYIDLRPQEWLDVQSNNINWRII